MFGRHDVSSIQAHVGRDAAGSATAMGARAYATGNHVVLGKGADLFTEAHEAAHVVQQRGGVQFSKGIGNAGDPYERHADDVASLVVQGKSAETLLDQAAGRDGRGAGGEAPPQIQRQDDDTLDAGQDQVAAPAPQDPESSDNTVEPPGRSERSDPATVAELSSDSPVNKLIPPWHIPGTDWKLSPTWKSSTDDEYDDPDKRERARRKQEDDPRGNGPKSPDVGEPATPPGSSPFTPEEDQLTKSIQEANRRAQQRIQEKNDAQKQFEEEMKRPAPDERGDYPLPPDDQSNV